MRRLSSSDRTKSFAPRGRGRPASARDAVPATSRPPLDASALQLLQSLGQHVHRTAASPADEAVPATSRPLLDASALQLLQSLGQHVHRTASSPADEAGKEAGKHVSVPPKAVEDMRREQASAPPRSAEAERSLLMGLVTSRLGLPSSPRSPRSSQQQQTPQTPQTRQPPPESPSTEVPSSGHASGHASGSSPKLLRSAIAATMAVARMAPRMAIASESTEQLASVRWQSAFDALRRAEQKTEEQLAELSAVLRKHPICSDLDDAVLLEVTRALRVQRARVGEMVITEGSAADAFFLVMDGELHAIKGGARVASYGKGDTFGDLALLYGAPRQATVKCVSAAATLYRLGRLAFRGLVWRAMAQRQAALRDQLASVELFRGLDSGRKDQLAEAMDTVVFEAGACIVEIGAPADSLFVLLSGEVVCHRAGVAELRLGPGAVFGESCLSRTSTNPEREASVTALGAVQCARLERTDCEAILGPIHAALDRAFASKVLCSIEVLSPLGAEQRATMLSQMRTRQVAAGDSFIRQGSRGDTLYIIKHGSADVITAAPPNPPTRLSTLGVGDYIGERSLLMDEVTVASVVAREPLELMCFHRGAVEGVLGSIRTLLRREVARRDLERQAAVRATPSMELADLSIRTLLGEGAFGSVRLCVHRTTGKPYALKQLHKGHVLSTNTVKNVVNEKQLLRRCEHPFILKCHGTFNTARHVSLLVGLAQGGEMFTRLTKVRKFTQKAATLYTAMIASALGFLGARSIAHRDLKLENLLFDADGYLKMVDFGFAKVVETRTYTFCGTPDYMPPETISGRGHNFAVDWWALGVLLYEMLHGKAPFASPNHMATFQRISAGKFVLSPQLSAESAHLIRRLLVRNPARRLGVLANGDSDVLTHPAVKWVDVPRMLRKELSSLPFTPAVDDPTDTSSFSHCRAHLEARSDKFDKHLNPKYDALWEKEFGLLSSPARGMS
jgi:cGMP-dependent protein kinase